MPTSNAQGDQLPFKTCQTCGHAPRTGHAANCLWGREAKFNAWWQKLTAKEKQGLAGRIRYEGIRK